jgi:hypothetical protein
MPSTSKKQHNFMQAIAHSPSFAKKVGVSQSVGKDFNAADKGKTFNKGGAMKKRRFDEGGGIEDTGEEEYSAHQVDLNRRRFYDEEPAAKAAPAKKAPNKSYRERFPQTERAAYTPKETTKQKTPAEQSRSDMLQGEAEKRKITSVPFPTESFKSKSKPSTYKTLKEKLAGNRDTEQGFKKGGAIMKNMFKGKESYGEEMKEAKAIKSGKISPKQYAMGEKSEEKMKKGGMPMKDGKPSFMKKFAKGGGIEARGKTKGTVIRMASGGSVSSASRRADGIAQRGKTRC